MMREMTQVPFQLRISGDEEGRANAPAASERAFISTQPVPGGFPLPDDPFLFQAEAKKIGFSLQKAGPEVAMSIIRGLEHCPCGDRMGEMGLFSPEKRRCQGDLRTAFQYLMGATGELERRLLQVLVVRG